MAKKKPTGDHKRYRNAGVTTLVIENKEINPGDEFEASLDPDYETQMFAGGHLELLQDQSSAADEAQAKTAEEGMPVSGATADVAAETEHRRSRRNQS